jgi:hypothetical protein
MSSYTNVRAPARTTPRSSCSMKSSWRRRTAENHPSFTRPGRTSFLIPPITCGVLRLQLHQTRVFRVITVQSSAEVRSSFHLTLRPANTLIVPAKLDPTLMKEPRVIQGVPRIPAGKARRKPIPSMLGPNSTADTEIPS